MYCTCPGTIKLNFGLRRVAVDEGSNVRGGFIPRLVVNHLDVDIGSLELQFFDSKMSGLINLLSRLFKDTIRRRLTETLATRMATQLGRLVGKLNSFVTRCVGAVVGAVSYTHLTLPTNREV